MRGRGRVLVTFAPSQAALVVIDPVRHCGTYDNKDSQVVGFRVESLEFRLQTY